MHRIVFIVGLVCALATPAPLYAWGYDAHKFIVDRAISLLPDALRPLFADPAMREEAETFIRADILDKVLLRDLPALYGIENTRDSERRRIFEGLGGNHAQDFGDLMPMLISRVSLTPRSLAMMRRR